MKKSRRSDCPDVLVTDTEFEKLRTEYYNTELLDDYDLLEAFQSLQAYAENNRKKFIKYSSHYRCLIGWVKDKVLQAKRNKLALAREVSYQEQRLNGGRR